MTIIAPAPLPSEMKSARRTVKTKATPEWETPKRTPIPVEIYSEIFGHFQPSQDDGWSKKGAY
ncbi:hypothetical protein BDZ89DRAFT_1138121 [Hymenopellis radicata]|nr:hypothetical protein BDZ89DRAFT_1138121 [Hymenopellis radicata]